MKTLFVTSELFPYNKTGGLGDVCAWLPRALKKAGIDIRYIMPAFPSILQQFTELTPVYKFENKSQTGLVFLWKQPILNEVFGYFKPFTFD